MKIKLVSRSVFDPYEPKEAELRVEYIRPLYYITLTKVYPQTSHLSDHTENNYYCIARELGIPIWDLYKILFDNRGFPMENTIFAFEQKEEAQAAMDQLEALLVMKNLRGE